MGEPAEKKEPALEVPLERFDRLLRLLERLALAQERQLQQEESDARRAAKKAGPTTAEAEARVTARLARLKR